jgi:HK97 family phage prohead protease
MESVMGQRRIAGHAIKFNDLSVNLGGFVELFRPSSVDRTLATTDVRALLHHDAGRLLGRKSAGTLRLSKDAVGLFVDVDLPDTSDGKDVYELVRRRDISGMSFGFHIAGTGEEWDLSGDIPLRIVTDSIIREVSPVSWPAYPSTDIHVVIPEREGRAATSGSTSIALKEKQLRQMKVK